MATNYLDAQIPWPQIIHIPTIGQPVTTWRDINGQTYTTGDIIEGGMIVGEPGRLINSGTVWVAAEKLSEAQAAGWQPLNPDLAGDHSIVMVRRWAP
jgi:hypothetical protein